MTKATAKPNHTASVDSSQNLSATSGRKRARHSAVKTTPTQTSAVKSKIKATTKTETLLALLKRSSGVTTTELMSASGWQNHSVRGFLAGAVKKKGLVLSSKKQADGSRRYRIVKREA